MAMVLIIMRPLCRLPEVIRELVEELKPSQRRFLSIQLVRRDYKYLDNSFYLSFICPPEPRLTTAQLAEQSKLAERSLERERELLREREIKALREFSTQLPLHSRQQVRFNTSYFTSRQ